ncbi:hypothetical protein KAU86_02945 [bacterium]|nr:hypothetical protein [bacterium]MCK4436885.1 hypothetical protein [bacterium]
MIKKIGEIDNKTIQQMKSVLKEQDCHASGVVRPCESLKVAVTTDAC